MKKTFAELIEIDGIVGNLYLKNPKIRNGKFGYAYNRFYIKNIKPISDEIQEKMVDSKIENALTDPNTKELLYDTSSGPQKLYKYTKEGMKKMVEESRKIIKEADEKEVEIKPFYTEDLPEMLDEEKEALKGCLIKE